MAKPYKTTALNFLCVLLTGVGVGWITGMSLSPVLHIIVGSVIALVAGAVGSLAGLHVARAEEESGGDKGGLAGGVRRGESVVAINPLPLAALVVGMVLGSSAGLYARTNEWFGVNPQGFARRWGGAGLTEEEVKRRLFDRIYPPPGSPAAARESAGDASATPADGAGVASGSGVSQGGQKDSQPRTARNTPAGRGASAPPAALPPHLAAGLFALTAQDCDTIRLLEGAYLKSHLMSIDKAGVEAYLAKCKDENACLEALKVRLCSGK